MAKKAWMVRNIAVRTLVIASLAGPATADTDALVGGLIGGMIGAALSNSQNSKSTATRSTGGTQTSSATRSTNSGMSAVQRQENSNIQNALNYFSFPVGSADGVLGQRSRMAISELQIMLGYPATGQLSVFERDFLINSYNRAQAGGATTMAQIAANPMGARGLLVGYRNELAGLATAPVAVAPTTNALVAPVPIAPVQVAPEAPAQVLVSAPSVTNQNAAVDALAVEKLQEDYDGLSEQIALLAMVIEHQKSLPLDDARTVRIAAIETRLVDLKDSQVTIEDNSKSKYSTPIRPDNVNLGMTAVKASEVFPRVPYFIPGTKEIGEMWVRPIITDAGLLQYDFTFMDPDATFATIRESIVMNSEEIQSAVDAFGKVDEWSSKAQSEGLRRNFEKSATCFPSKDCTEKKVGNSSTEIVFALYEDGSTAAKVQRNKGPVSVSFNFSIESSRLLSAYLSFMKDVGEKDFVSGTMTDATLDEMFQ